MLWVLSLGGYLWCAFLCPTWYMAACSHLCGCMHNWVTTYTCVDVFVHTFWCLYAGTWALLCTHEHLVFMCTCLCLDSKIALAQTHFSSKQNKATTTTKHRVKLFMSMILITLCTASLWRWFYHLHFANELDKSSKIGSSLLWILQQMKVEPVYGLVWLSSPCCELPLWTAKFHLFSLWNIRKLPLISCGSWKTSL